MSYSKKDLVNFRFHKAKETFQDALLLVDTGSRFRYYKKSLDLQKPKLFP